MVEDYDAFHLSEVALRDQKQASSEEWDDIQVAS